MLGESLELTNSTFERGRWLGRCTLVRSEDPILQVVMSPLGGRQQNETNLPVYIPKIDVR